MLLARRYRDVLWATSSALAIPQNPTPEPIPASLAASLPFCAQSCVALLVRTAWPSAVCSSTDLGCLCTSRSLSGFTLGEMGLQCLASSCPASAGEDKALSQTIYQVCRGVEDALPNTHPVLTATSPVPLTATTRVVRPVGPRIGVSQESSEASTTGSWGSSSSTRQVMTSSPTSESSSSSADARTSTTSTPLQTTAAVSTTISTSTVLSTSAQSPPAPSTPAAPASGASNRPLTREQIIGILVGGGLALAILSGLAILLGLRCGSRRRKRKVDTVGFNVLTSPAKKGFGETGAERGWYSGGAGSVRRPASTNSRPATAFDSPQPLQKLSRPWSNRNHSHSDGIGLAISPESRDSTHRTPLSAAPARPARSNSTLLPDKPVYRPAWPVPLQPHRPFSETTLIEDDDHDGASRRRSSQYSGGTTNWPARYSLFPEEDDAHLRGYQFARQMSPRSPPMIPPPVPVSESAMARMRRGDLNSSSARRSRHSMTGSSRAHRNHQHHHRRRQPSSNGSITSFETDHHDHDGDHEAPLTPVREIAGEHEGDMSSPISPERLKYPAVPRSLSSTPVRMMATSQPTRPAAPLRNDTFSRNEDLVIATSQALTKATGGSNGSPPVGAASSTGQEPWSSTDALIVSYAKEEEIEQLHLTDEVQRAKQGLAMMRERAAVATKNINLQREREREQQAEEMRRSILGYLSPMSSSVSLPSQGAWHSSSGTLPDQHQDPQRRQQPYHGQQQQSYQGPQQQPQSPQHAFQHPSGSTTMAKGMPMERRAIPGTMSTGTGSRERMRPSPSSSSPPTPSRIDPVKNSPNNRHAQRTTSRTRRGPELRVVI